MARLITSGFESQIFSTTASQNGEGQTSAVSGTVAGSTSVTNPGGSACSLTTTQAGGAGQMIWTGLGLSNGTVMYARFYVRFGTIAQAAIHTFATITGNLGGNLLFCKLDTAGKFQLHDVNGQVGSASAALSSNTWYEVILLAQLAASPTTSNGTAVMQYRAPATQGISARTTVAAGVGNLNLDVAPLDGISLGSSAAFTGTCWYDDLAVNDSSGSAPHNTYPDGGHVVHLMPAADQAVGTSWEQPKTTGSDTTDLYDSVDNVPPVGVAHADTDANNLKYIFNAANLGAASDYAATTTDYTTAGFPNNDIAIVQGLFRLGGASTTGTNDGAGRISSNPTDSGITTFTGGYDIVSGTEPSSWNVFRSAQVLSPNPTRGTGARVVVRKSLTGAARTHMCDYMAAVVEFADTVVPLATAAATASATLAPTAPTQIPLAAASAAATATIAITATTQIPLDASSATATATLALKAATVIPLDASSGASSATLAVTAATQIPLDPATATASATLAITAATVIALDAAAAAASATLALAAPTVIALDAASAQSTAALAVGVPVFIPLDPAAATSSAAATLTAPTGIPLDASAATATASLALAAPTQIALQTSAAVSTATIAVTAATVIALDAAAATSTASLAVAAPTVVALGTSAATSTAALSLAAPTQIPLDPAAATSTASIAITAPTQIPLQASAGQSTASLFLTGPVEVPLGTSTAVSTSSVVVTAATQIPLNASAGSSSAALNLAVAVLLALDTAGAVSSASLDLLAPTLIALDAAAGLSSATLDIVPFPAGVEIALQQASGASSAFLFLVPTGTLLQLVSPRPGRIAQEGQGHTTSDESGEVGPTDTRETSGHIARGQTGRMDFDTPGKV